MQIKSIKTSNFRNLASETIHFGKGLNIIQGKNGQGKTNLLEAVYFSATAHSHRTGQAVDMINTNADINTTPDQNTIVDESTVETIIIRDNGGYKDKINSVIRRKGRSGAARLAAVNGLGISKLGDLMGVLYTVMFSPEDLGLIKAGPAERRRFMDMELCQINALYYHNLNQYHKTLKQRNALLKYMKRSTSHDLTALDVWDEQLSIYGEAIHVSRNAYINEISQLAERIHKELCGEEFSAIYKPSAMRGELGDRLRKSRTRDIATGTTTVGIHKDDILFTVNGVDSRIYASQGQSRTAALAVKLAEAAFIRHEKYENPVLLLDDVMSELDPYRQAQLYERIDGLQTLVTVATDESGGGIISPANITDVKYFIVSRGIVDEVIK
ncbi:MAG: DNA replication/repair protein RecF [Defluviitaleaceae bacterium]|nr:DNA replication/repair protein RecF [Defluviitaleaceae bacterium]